LEFSVVGRPDVDAPKAGPLSLGELAEQRSTPKWLLNVAMQYGQPERTQNVIGTAAKHVLPKAVDFSFGNFLLFGFIRNFRHMGPDLSASGRSIPL
jgi:hypothetical protein